MSYVDWARDQLIFLTDLIEEALDWVDSEGPDILRALLNRYLDTIAPLPIPGTDAFIDQVIAELHDAVSFAHDVLDFVRGMIAMLGSPDALRAAADELGRQGDRATTLADGLILSRIPSSHTENWVDGAASERYRDAIDGRDDAVRKITDIVASLSGGLKAMASQIETFWSGLITAVVGIEVAVIGVVGGLTACIGVVTAPVGAAIGLASAIIGLITAVVGLIMFLVNLGQSVDGIRGQLGVTIPQWQAALA